MRRFFVLLTFGAALAALGAVACGDGNKQPPLTPDTPDTEHSPAPVDGADAEAPSDPSAAPATN